MNNEIKGYRFLVFLCLCLLTILLALMASKLFSELQDLSVADGASFKVWHSYQTKSQLADLDSILTEEIANESFLTSRLQESLDIALSKVFVLKNDDSRAYLWDGEVRQDLLSSLLHFETFALAIAEKPAQITVYDLKKLKGFTSKSAVDSRSNCTAGRGINVKSIAGPPDEIFQTTYMDWWFCYFFFSYVDWLVAYNGSYAAIRYEANRCAYGLLQATRGNRSRLHGCNRDCGWLQ